MQPVSEEWYDEHHTIMIVHYAKVWWWADYYVAAKRGLDMVAQEPHPVVLIHDQPTVPSDRTPPFAPLNWVRDKIPPNVAGTIVVLPPNTFTGRFITNILTVLRRIRISKEESDGIVIVASMAEALELAQRRLAKHPANTPTPLVTPE
jgi:hypothetical protein